MLASLIAYIFTAPMLPCSHRHSVRPNTRGEAKAKILGQAQPSFGGQPIFRSRHYDEDSFDYLLL